MFADDWVGLCLATAHGVAGLRCGFWNGFAGGQRNAAPKDPRDLFKRTHLEQAAQPFLDMPGLDHHAVLKLVDIDCHD